MSSDDASEAPTENGENGDGAVEKKARRRRERSFPGTSFAEALFIADAIQKHGAGQQIRRLTLLEAVERSPDSSLTRKLITASAQYGITTGSYKAEFLDLTDKGRLATDALVPAASRLKARIQLAIMEVPPFKAVFEKYKSSRLPSVQVLRDAMADAGVDEAEVAEAVETFLANARDLGLIRTIGGSEHLVSAEDVLDRLPDASEEDAIVTGRASGGDTTPERAAAVTASPEPQPAVTARTDLQGTCFVVSPIGAEDSEQRLHADLVLSSLIEPALRELGLEPVRADQISKPGMITGQVIDHLARAKMVIADLSFGNPNVYYELALRHATRKPVVQIIRSADTLPFDVGQFRTVVIDMSSIYTLVPKLDLHRQEIARQCRAAMEDGEAAESPLSRFYPSFWEYVPSSKRSGAK
ncbi:hypothetical protein [Actinotalea fermentans]|nr:hypothetical protein [Actinotalea fermentans]